MDPWTYEKTFGDEDFTITPQITGDGAVSYSSEDENVATVDRRTGLVHIVSAGTVNIFISVAATNNYTSAFDWCELRVNPKVTEEGGVTIVDSGNDIEVTVNDQDAKLEGVTLPEGLQVDKLNYSRELSGGDKVYTYVCPTHRLRRRI